VAFLGTAPWCASMESFIYNSQAIVTKHFKKAASKFYENTPNVYQRLSKTLLWLENRFLK
jgi:hypothetical protein